jgi:hypothetical protein
MSKEIIQVYRVEWFSDATGKYTQEYYSNAVNAANRLVGLEENGCKPMLETVPLL